MFQLHPMWISWISHSSPSSPFIITIWLLPALAFRPLLHTNKTSRHCPQIFLRLTIQNLIICIQEPRQFQLSPLLPILIFTSSITASIYAFNSQEDMIYPCLSPLWSWTTHSIPILLGHRLDYQHTCFWFYSIIYHPHPTSLTPAILPPCY